MQMSKALVVACVAALAAADLTIPDGLATDIPVVLARP